MASDMEQEQGHIDGQEQPTASTSASGTETGAAGESSRDSPAGAGWTCREVGRRSRALSSA
jgi:hypothetical protein